jgi:hypothetical protein
VGIIERELRHLYRDIRNWNIKQMREEDRYMVTFPSEEMRYQVAKFKSFEFETANVKAKVIPTEMSAEADGKHESVWVRAHRFPLFARKVEVVMEIGYLVGDPEEVDLTTLNKPGPVRIKIACVDVTKVRGESRVFFNGESYNLIDRGKRKMRMRKKRKGSLVMTKTLDLSHRRRGVETHQ